MGQGTTVSKQRALGVPSSWLVGLIFVLSWAILSCDRGGPHRPVMTTTAEKPGSTVGETVIYSDVEPVFRNHCSGCHPSVSPPNWLSYEEAKTRTVGGSKSRLYIRVEAGLRNAPSPMPPAGTPQAAQMSSAERQLLMAWAAAEGPRERTQDSEEAPAVPPSEATPPTAPPVPPTPAPADGPPERVAALLQQCGACHGANGVSTNPMFPSLAGQMPLYLKSQLVAFRSGERKNPMMNGITAGLSDEDIEGLVTYYSGLSLGGGL